MERLTQVLIGLAVAAALVFVVIPGIIWLSFAVFVTEGGP